MSPQLEQILNQVHQLSIHEQLQLIHHLVDRTLPELADSNLTDSSHTIIGSFEHDPQFDQFLEAINQYRHELDAELRDEADHSAA